MLLPSVAPALLAIMAGIANAESFGDLASCGQQCINNMDTSTGCVPVTSECLCSNSNFLFGIRDCANSACTNAADATAAYSYATASCSSVLTPAATTAAATTATPETTSEAAATTSEAEATTSSTIVNANAQATSSTATSAEATEASATTGSVAQTPATGSPASATDTAASGMTTLTGSATKASSSSTTTGAAAAASSSSASNNSSTSSNVTNLSTGAKAGIVVGSAVGAVAIVGIVLYLSRKRTQPLPRGNLKISEPLPGSGRIGDEVWEQYHQPSPPYTPQYQKQFATRPPGTAGSNMTELDRHARPYEDMVPRTTPARMV